MTPAERARAVRVLEQRLADLLDDADETARALRSLRDHDADPWRCTIPAELAHAGLGAVIRFADLNGGPR